MSLSFDPKFTWGNVITIGTIIVAAVGAYYKQSLDTAAVKEKITYETGQTETKLLTMKIELTTQITQLQTQLAVTMSRMEGLQKDIDGIDDQGP